MGQSLKPIIIAIKKSFLFWKRLLITLNMVLNCVNPVMNVKWYHFIENPKGFQRLGGATAQNKCFRCCKSITWTNKQTNSIENPKGFQRSSASHGTKKNPLAGKTFWERVERLRNLFKGIDYLFACNYIKTNKIIFGTVCNKILI